MISFIRVFCGKVKGVARETGKSPATDYLSQSNVTIRDAVLSSASHLLSV